MKTSKALHIKIQVITIILSREHELPKIPQMSDTAWPTLLKWYLQRLLLETLDNSVGTLGPRNSQHFSKNILQLSSNKEG